MICLGIESTAHTFGVGIVRWNGTILANLKESVTSIKGGMIPAEVAKHHREVANKILHKALEAAKVSLNNINLISYSAGPGLPPCLRVGRDEAVRLSKQENIPLIGINHCVAHLTIGDLLCKTQHPLYVYVSGVNTQIIALAGKRLRVFGETLDIGLGNALDKFGRAANLGFPAGAELEKKSEGGTYIELPYAVKGMDVSFSGIVTKAQRLLKEGTPLSDVCFSMQETCFAMLTEIAERALSHTEKKTLLLVGGVAANKRLCNMLQIMCKERGATFAAVPLEFSGDQGAMIAWQGILENKSGRVDNPELADIRPYERTDDVDVTW